MRKNVACVELTTLVVLICYEKKTFFVLKFYIIFLVLDSLHMRVIMLIT